MSKALAAVAILIFTLSVPARGNEVEVDLQSALVEGGETSPIKIEPVAVTSENKSMGGINVTFEFREKCWVAVIIPTDVSAKEFNTLVFTVKFEGDDELLNDFGVWVLDQDGAWIAVDFLKFANPSRDGWYEFRWDLTNYLAEFPEKKINLENIKRIWIKYNIPGIPEGQKVRMTFGHMKFEADPVAQPSGKK